MRNTTVITSNINNFLTALERLETRGPKEEGMGLLWGQPGEGKSTTISYLLNHRGGIFLRARVTWSVTTMLRAILTELGLAPGRYRDAMIHEIIFHLSHEPRPIFVDEADYLFRQTEMLDALRDVYDSTRVPIILISMEDIARRIRSADRFNRFRRRITEWVEFKGLTLEDARLAADDLCEVEVGDDLVGRMHKETNGNIGNIVIGLGMIERFGKANGFDRVDLAAYGNRPLTPSH